MAKTRSQSAKTISIKREEEEDSKSIIKHTQLLSRVSKAAKTSGNITKKNINSLSVSETKLEEGLNESTPLQIRQTKNHKFITQEQITSLIGYIVDNKMSVPAASRKVNICHATGLKYYNMYKDDPERKIPDLSKLITDTKPFTQEQIQSFFDYIIKDKMSVYAASVKANISRNTGRVYYKIYKNDPERKIPMPLNQTVKHNKHCTPEQINLLIQYIVKDGLSPRAASIKAKIGETTGRKYYRLYLEDPERKIPTLWKRTRHSNTPYTQEKLKTLINYIVKDKMSLHAASIKSKINFGTAAKYYNRYLEDPERKIPTPAIAVPFNKPYSQEKKAEFIRHIVEDKMTIKAASQKLDISYATGLKYYSKFLKNPKGDNSEKLKRVPIFIKRYTQDEIKALIDHVEKEDMTVKTAAKKINMNYSKALMYYKSYKSDPEHNIPRPSNRNANTKHQCSPETIRTLINHIVEDKMTITKASKKSNISKSTGIKYYRMYIQDPEHKIPDPSKKTTKYNKACTQEQINIFFKYVIDDKLTIAEASRKINVSQTTGRRYYSMYEDDPERNIPGSLRRDSDPGTKDRIKEFIGYIVDDRMTVSGAARKAKISSWFASKYYSLYLKDHKVPEPLKKPTGPKTVLTQDQIKAVIGFIVDDKMTLAAASRKANMSSNTALRYYSKYLKDPNHRIPTPAKFGMSQVYSPDQIEQVIGYLVNDKMTFRAAATKAKMSGGTAYRYYRQYLNNLKSQNTVNPRRTLRKYSFRK